MVIFWCQDTFESILCGVYDAWMSRLGHANVKLKLRECGNLELFAENREVQQSEEKVGKVMDSIRAKISSEALLWVYWAALSCDGERADKIYRFLIYGFHFGGKVTEYLQIPAVNEMFRIKRNIGNEAHHMKEFVRFSEMAGGILFSKIGPKNDVLPLIMPHFADRLRTDRFLIYDENRKRAAICEPDHGWLLFHVDSEEQRRQLEAETDGKEYEELWRLYHQSVAIRERENYVCQRTHLPLRFRPYMTEFLQNTKE